MKISLSEKIQLFKEVSNQDEIAQPSNGVELTLVMLAFAIGISLAGFLDFGSLVVIHSLEGFLLFSVVVTAPALLLAKFLSWFWGVAMTYKAELIKKYGLPTTGIITDKTEKTETVTLDDEHQDTLNITKYNVEYTFEHEGVKYKKMLNQQFVYHAVEVGDEVPIKFLATNPKKALLIHEELTENIDAIVINMRIIKIDKRVIIKKYGTNYNAIYGEFGSILSHFQEHGDFIIHRIEYQFIFNAVAYEIEYQVGEEHFNHLELESEVPIHFLKKHPEKASLHSEYYNNIFILQYELSGVEFLVNKTATIVNKRVGRVNREMIIKNFGQAEYKLQLDDLDSIHREFQFRGEFELYIVEYQFEYNTVSYTVQNQLSEQHYEQLELDTLIPIYFFESDAELATIISEHSVVNQFNLSAISFNNSD